MGWMSAARTASMRPLVAVVVAVGQAPFDRVVERGAQRPDVGLDGGEVLAHDLRRRVGQGGVDRADHRDGRVAVAAGDAVVAELHGGGVRLTNTLPGLMSRCCTGGSSSCPPASARATRAPIHATSGRGVGVDPARRVDDEHALQDRPQLRARPSMGWMSAARTAR
jgi:hypothetical protein